MVLPVVSERVISFHGRPSLMLSTTSDSEFDKLIVGALYRYDGSRRRLNDRIVRRVMIVSEENRVGGHIYQLLYIF